ncbi:MAG: hypothetical protein WCD69_05110 [Xanthobacteraceae bacterium]
MSKTDFEDEPARSIGGENGHERRGAPNRGELRQAAGAVASVDDVYLSEGLIVLTAYCSKKALERDHANPILVVGCRIAHGIASHDDT